MIPPQATCLVKYNSPVLVNTTKDKGKNETKKKPGKGGDGTTTEDILNSILPPRYMKW